MTLTLYTHQDKQINETRTALSLYDSVLLEAPTGGGKTVMSSFIMKRAEAKGLRSVFAVHRNELLEQSVAKLQAVGLDPGVIASGYEEEPNKLVQVASIQSIAVDKRLMRWPAPSLFVPDECHHLSSSQWRKVRAFWSVSKMVGLSATPERHDGQGLSEFFQTMVRGPSVGWLIQNGFLAPYRAWAPSKPATEELPMGLGDYRRADNEALMNKPSITGDAIATYCQLATGKKAICFCVSIKHSLEVAEAFHAAGISAVHLDGDTPKDIRKAAMAAFRSGKIQVLCNVDLFGEGLDVPDAEVGIFLRPTASFGLWRQQVGRILRYLPGKVAFLLDHAGNFEKHGLPDDEVEWSLAGRQKMSRKTLEGRLAVRTCPACYAVSPAAAKCCEKCGAAFPMTPREVKKLEGQLAEILKTRAVRERKQEQREAKSLDALIALAKTRGYKNPWAWAKKQMELRERWKVRT